MASGLTVAELRERVAGFKGETPRHQMIALALAEISRRHGGSFRASQPLGVPVSDDEAVEPRHLADAALQAGLKLDERPVPASRLLPIDCPALAILNDGTIAVVDAIDSRDGADFARLRVADGSFRALSRREADTCAAFRVAPFAGAEGEQPQRRFLSGVARGTGPLYLQVVFATVAINILALALPLYTMNIYDRVLPTNAVDTLTALTVGAALATAFDFALKTLRGALTDKASQRIDARLANRLHARMLGARLTPGLASTGVRANTLREYETLRELFSSTTLTVLGDIPFALLFLTIMFMLAGPIAGVVVVAIPLIILANLIVNWPLARLQEQAFRDTAIRSTIITETLNGLETVKAMGAEAWAGRRYERAIAENLRVSFWSRLWAMLGMNMVMAGQAAATIAAVVYGCFLVARGDITGGALMASMMLIGRVLGPFSQIAAIAGKLHSGRLAWNAVKTMATAPQERERPEAFVRLPERLGPIVAEGVAFGYDPKSPPALQPINLTINQGERVGFIGGIGSGKTTLLKLLVNLHQPSAGRITIGGLALADIDPLELRRRVGWCGQAPQLFQGSLRQNLMLHRPGASDADLLAAAAITGAMGWIGRLPRGLDTCLGENGAGLSGGQRQSIALTRALIGAPDLLLLDEPTSDMDGRMEAHVVRQLKAATGDRTLILVTHRPALLDLVDRLVVFDNGRIVSDGPKAEVLQILQAQRNREQAA